MSAIELWLNPYVSDVYRGVALDAKPGLETGWTAMAGPPTPLLALDDLARQIGVSALWVKDESQRMGGSFKTLGVLAAFAHLERSGSLKGVHTVACATTGNHGRATAIEAGRRGFRTVVYCPSAVAEGLRRVLHGSIDAEIVPVRGDFDEALALAEASVAPGRILLSDTPRHGSADVPMAVVRGYGHVLEEAYSQLGSLRPTAVVVQAGGGQLLLACSVWCHSTLGLGRPRLVAAEPLACPSVMHAVRHQRSRYEASGGSTAMRGLKCFDISPVVWGALTSMVDGFSALSDDWLDTARSIACGTSAESLLRTGSPTGLCGLTCAMALATSSRSLRDSAFPALHGEAVLVINTEERWL